MSGSLSTVRLKYRIGEVTLGSVGRRMLVRNVDAFREACSPDEPDLRVAEIPRGTDGVLLRSVPVDASLPVLAWTDGRVRYVPRQYERYYADLGASYEEYLGSFSSKSRSSLRRKVRKFERESGGRIHWGCYRTPNELEEFYRHARKVSEESYQERLLDAGLPGGEDFRRAMLEGAAEDNVRGYLIFLGSEALAYLYCPVRDGVVLYAYLGYRPGFEHLSPGTVLLWLAIESLFGEGKHRIFDFTEGGDSSRHSQKRLFSTASLRCADIYVLKPTVLNFAIVGSHVCTEWLVEGAGAALSRFGIKRGVKRVLRRLW